MIVRLRTALAVLAALAGAMAGTWLVSSTIPAQLGTAGGPVGLGPMTTPTGPASPSTDGRPKHRPADRGLLDRGLLDRGLLDRGLLDRGLGVQLSAHHGVTATRALRVMSRLRQAGAHWVRVDVGWSALQPHGPGRFDRWYAELVDDVVAGARARGLRVILNLWLTPPWASASGSPYSPPTDVDDYAAALERAADRWGRDVAAWEIWNEPNFPTFFEGADPATYTRLLCAAYPAVKRHDDSPVLFGGLMYNDDAWLTAAYRAGAKPCFDALATHPYVGPSDAAPDTPAVGAVWRLTHTPAMRDVMDEWGDRRKRIWVTELGWSSGPDNEGNPWDRSVPPRVQARFLREAVELIRREYPYVGPIIWYRDVDGPTDSYQDGFGLMHPDLSPKPAFAAFRAAVLGKGA